MVPNLEKKGDYYVNLCLSQLANKLEFQKMVERKAFLMKPKQHCHSSQLGEWVYGAQSWKERTLLCEHRSVPIERQTSIPKMVERKIFLMKPKHQYHLSHRVKCVYDAES